MGGRAGGVGLSGDRRDGPADGPLGSPIRAPDELRTERLWLHRWRAEDRAPFAALNGDPDTMAFYPTTLTRQQSDLLVDRFEACFDDPGISTWAVGTADGEFVGAVGLLPVRPEAFSFGPTVEVGWRLTRPIWGHGYATEAARIAMDWAFTERRVPEIVAFTSAVNVRSRAVMERLGMGRDPAEDFDHPRIAPGHRLERHVLYRVSAAAWGHR